MNYIEDKDPKYPQIFVGATTTMIPFNSILQHDQTMEEKNWGVRGRLRMKRYDSVLDFLLMLGGAISKMVSSFSPNSKGCSRMKKIARS